MDKVKIQLLAFDTNKHLGILAHWLQDQELMHGWGMKPFESLDKVLEWVVDPTRVILMVEDKTSGKIVGMVNFYDWNKEKKVASRGTLIDPEFQNRGFGKEAIFQSNEYAFSVLGLNRIELYVEADNEKSRHITEKLGYKFVRFDDAKKRYYYYMEKPL